MSKFYVSRNQQQFGPFTSEQLKQLAASGKIARDDLVVEEGGSKWVAASCIRGLFSTIQVLPASPIPADAASPSASGDSDADTPWLSGDGGTSSSPTYKSKVGRKPKKTDNTMLYMIGGGVALLLLLGVIGLALDNGGSGGSRADVGAGGAGRPNQSGVSASQRGVGDASSAVTVGDLELLAKEVNMLSDNTLARNKRIKEIRNDLEKLVGKQLIWRVQVYLVGQSVSDDKAEIVYSIPGSNVTEVRTPTPNGPVMNRLEVGRQISEELAQKLHRGDTFTLSGKFKRIFFFDGEGPVLVELENTRGSE